MIKSCSNFVCYCILIVAFFSDSSSTHTPEATIHRTLNHSVSLTDAKVTQQGLKDLHHRLSTVSQTVQPNITPSPTPTTSGQYVTHIQSLQQKLSSTLRPKNLPQTENGCSNISTAPSTGENSENISGCATADNLSPDREEPVEVLDGKKVDDERVRRMSRFRVSVLDESDISRLLEQRQRQQQCSDEVLQSQQNSIVEPLSESQVATEGGDNDEAAKPLVRDASSSIAMDSIVGVIERNYANMLNEFINSIQIKGTPFFS